MDNQETKTKVGGAVAEAIKAVFDPITRFGEGIAQTINDLFKDLKFWQKLVMVALAGYSFKVGLRELRKLLLDDPELEAETVDYLKREEFLDWLEEHGEEAWQAVQKTARNIKKLGKKFYKYLQNIEIPHADEFISRSNERNQQFLDRIARAKRQRQKTFRYGTIALLILLFLATTVNPDKIPWGLVGLVLVVLVAIVLFVIHLQSRRPEPNEQVPSEGRTS